MKKLVLIALLICISHITNGQNEYLAIVNSVNCSYNKFDSIPNVHWIGVNSSAIDENNHRYFFIGTPTSYTPSSLYIINTLTGGVMSSYKMISGTGDSLLIGLEYDNSSDTLYGILEANSEQNTYFVWIDLTSGAIHSISAIPDQGFAIGSSTYDKNHHRYFYTAGNKQYVIDARTGNVIFSYPTSPYNYLIKYNNTTDKLYGLTQPVVSQWEFDSITVSTGATHNIASMPFQSIIGMPVFKAMNETHGKYICVGQISGIYSLYTIDINTGNVAYQPTDTLLGNNDNLIEFQYDNIQDTLFALHWGPSSSPNGIIKINLFTSNINIFPNPANSSFTIELSTIGKQTLQIFDVTGKLVLSQTIESIATIDASSLSEGVYNISITNSIGILNKRLVVVK